MGKISRPGQIYSWDVQVAGQEDNYTAGRICVLRKTEEAIRLAHKKLKRRAEKKGNIVKEETLIYAKYVMVFTTFPPEEFSSCEVLEWYRLRWQVELVFKRFKQVAQLGHLPKHDDESAQAWLYGKLFVALLTEKLIGHAESFSPGDTTWPNRKAQSRWREFAFVLHQILRAVEPALPLREVLSNWNEIAQSLAEKERARKIQLTKYFEYE